MDVYLRLGFFRAFDVAIRNLQRQILSRVPGNPTAVRIEAWLIEVVTIFIRFAAGEHAAFDFDIAPNQTGRGDAERNMRRILPVMSDWRVGIVHRRWAMHKRRWTECRFTRIAEVYISAKIVIELLRQAQRKFVEQIVRMLAIVQGLVVPGFTGLK